MVKKTRGTRRGTRRLLRRRVRDKTPITKYIQDFKNGEKVQIIIDPSAKSIPFPKFHGKVGTVKEKRGSSYLVSVGKKTVIARSEHLRKA